jgi:outer membrane receptor protein involved in Fe transport
VIGREERDQVGPLQGYQALTSSTATRTNTPIQEIPQSVTVIPRSLFTDQGAVTLDQALRNSGSVVPESPLFLNQNLNTLIRGFAAEIYRDGLQSFGKVGLAQSLLGVERIEIVKGPSGALFGGGLGGGFEGVVNIISQRPLPSNSYAAGVTFDPYGYRNPWVDLNQAYRDHNGTTYTVRLQAEYQYGRSYTENLKTDGYQVLPTLSITNDRTNLVVQAFFSQRTANDYPGLPPEISGGSPRMGIDRFVNANGANVPRTQTTRNGTRVGIGYDILPGLTSFMGWGNSIRSPGGYGFSGFLTNPKPEESQQFEAGVKLNLPFGLSGTLACFNIERSNVPYFDPLAGGNRQIGEQRSRGFDLDLLWQPDAQFSLLGSFAYTMAETVSDSIIAPGTPLRLVPRNAGRVWANYRLHGLALPDRAQGFSIGGGLTSVAGASTSDQPNAIRTAGYTIFDAAINYDTGPLRVSVAGRNVGNRNDVIPFSYFNNSMARWAGAARRETARP